MLSKLIKSKLVLSFCVSLIITLICFQLDLAKLTWFFYDNTQKLSPSQNTSGHISLIKIPAPAFGTLESEEKMNLEDTHKLIQEIYKFNPKQLFYTFSPKFLEYDPYLEKFNTETLKYKNFHWLTFSSDHDEFLFIESNPKLKGLRADSAWFPPDYVSLAKDKKSRRTVYEMLGKNEPAFEIAKLYDSVPKFKGTISNDRYKSVLIRYRSPSVYPLNDYRQISREQIENKLVILGSDSTFSVFYSKDTPISSLLRNPYVLASALDTVVLKDNPKLFSKINDFLICFLLLFVSTWIILSVSIKTIFFSSFILLFFNLFLYASVYYFTDWLINIGIVALGIFIIQYLLVPYILLKNIKKAGEENLRSKLAISEAKIAAKSAKADLGFRIAAQVAHDIRSPVMALQTVRMMIAPQLKPEVLRLLNNSIDRINGIADSLLKKFRSGTIEILNEAAPVDVAVTIQDLVHSYANTHPKITFRLNNLNAIALVHVEKTDIERALSNIINNAVEAMNFSGEIEISISQYDDFIKIWIKDCGVGIAPEIQAKIFNSGFTQGKTGGTGIGLSQAKEAFKKQGGDVSLISSKPGETFFELKLKKSIANDFKITTAQNVIIIEDVKDTQNVWEKILNDHQINYLCFENFKTFKEKFELQKGNFFQSKKYTLITDMIFEGDDETGFDLIQFARQSHSHLILDYYMCTSLSSNEDIQQLCKGLGIKMFGKKDLDKLEIQVANS